MVVPGNDQLDAILNSVQVVKNVFSPLETSIRKVAKDFEKCWPGLNMVNSRSRNIRDKVEQRLMEINVEKKSRTNGFVYSDDRKNVFSPLETSIRKVAKDFEKCWPGLNMVNSRSRNIGDKVEQRLMEINVEKKSRTNGFVYSDDRKNVFSPLETSIRKVAKDFEKCWPGLNQGKSHSGDIVGKIDQGFIEIDAEKKSRVNEFGYSDDRNRYLLIKLPDRVSIGFLAGRNGNDGVHDKDGSCRDEKLFRKGLKGKYGSGKGDGTCINCLDFVVAVSVLINGFVQAFSFPFVDGKKRVEKVCSESKSSYKPIVSCGFRRKGRRGEPFQGLVDEGLKGREGNDLSFEYLLAFLVDELTKNFQQLDASVQERECKRSDQSLAATTFDRWKVFTSILEGKKADLNGFLQNLSFARVGGVPSSMVGTASAKEESDHDINNAIHTEQRASTSAQKLASDLLSIPLANVERLRTTMSNVSLTELIELLPQLGHSTQDHPDKKKLISVQDFFRYTETEGRRFFEELDRDGDGQVNLEDLEVAMRKRKLPRRYAREFMHRARRHLFSKSFGWKQFLSLIEQKEPTILRAYTSLCLSKSGTLQKNEILASLKNAGLPANEDNAVAMLRFLNADTEESISYGHFRNFMLLLPSYRLQEDPRCIWFESATVVAVAPPVEIPTGSFLKSALAGGLACALSTSLLYPVDTIKTQVQASTLSFPEIISRVPQLGVRGLYRGSIPAIWGQFSSHGLRTGIFEATKLVLVNIAPRLPELQVQSVASFCGTFVGTAIRIPCEVLKQRLQAGLFENVTDAVNGTWQQDGLRGFFRGTGATLFREIPFYVVGMGLYAESKKAVQQILSRELEPWETITVGAVSGGISAVLTTPFDVIKTRMMTAPLGRPVSLSMVAFSIIRLEGPLGLFKGAIPRFFWIAPLGAMNFAGYELAKKAMEKDEGTVTGELDSEK